MPKLANSKHEAVAQAYIVDPAKVGWRAYQKVYPNATQRAAETCFSRLLSTVEFSSRIAEFHERAAERAEITVQKLLDYAEEARQLAIKIEQPNSAVAAIREMGVLSGKRIERSEQGKPGEFESMTEDELRAFIAGGATSDSASGGGTASTAGTIKARAPGRLN